MEFWNEINLPLPPYSSYKVSREKIDVSKFSKALQLDFFTNLTKFHNESAQLSRLIFMNCKQFRIMKGLHEMKKAHQSLLRYLNLNLVSVIETFKGFICDEPEAVTVPHQQNLDFILIRLQGLAKLLIRVVECCRRSASYFLGLIKAGSFYTKGVVFVGTIGSVWSQSREICKVVVTQYNELRDFRDKLRAKPDLKWLNEEYELPENLETWLGEDYIRFIANRTYDGRLLKRIEDIDYFKLNESDLCDHLSRMKKDKINEDSDEMENGCSSDNNHAEELELEDFAPIPRNVEKSQSTSYSTNDHSFSSLKSKDSIKTFIKNETFFRKVDQLKSLTIGKMKKKAWKDFKDDIKNKVVLMQEKTFVDYVNDYLAEYSC